MFDLSGGCVECVEEGMDETFDDDGNVDGFEGVGLGIDGVVVDFEEVGTELDDLGGHGGQMGGTAMFCRVSSSVEDTGLGGGGLNTLSSSIGLPPASGG